MPYEVSFTRRVPVVDREQYINDCCIGGDVLVKQLLPSLRARYTDIQTNQEDWGWFIWFRKGSVRLAIDIFTDDPDEGAFRVHLTSRTTRLLVLNTVVDTSELDELRALVASELAAWVDGEVRITRLDRDYSNTNHDMYHRVVVGERV
jgi:hypothetical protein